MIRIAVDGAPWTGEAARWESAEALFAAVERELGARGRAVVEVACNGVPLREDDLGDLDGWTVREGDRWSFTSRDHAAVLRDAVAGALEFSDRLGGEIAAIAGKLRTDDPGAVQDRWRACLDGLSVLSGLTPLFEGAAAGIEGRIRGPLGEIAGVLSAVEEALRGEDWVYVGDLLESRLAPAVGAWREALEEARGLRAV